METNQYDWSPDQDEYILTRAGHDKWDAIAARLERPVKVVKRRHRTLIDRLLEKMKVSSGSVVESQMKSQGSDGRIYTCVSNTIRTLEDAVAAAKVDQSIWEVRDFEINKWDLGAKTSSRNIGTRRKPHWVKDLSVIELWQVKVWLRRRTDLASQSMADAIIDRMKSHAFVYRPLFYTPPKEISQARFMLEVSPFDLHVGRRSWGLQTGRDDYDIPKARNLLTHAIEEILDYVRHRRIEQIVFPIGNDLLHVDGEHNGTTKGTPQDTSAQWREAYLQAIDLLVWTIDRLRQVAPTRVVVVPGNHDRESSFTLGQVINAWYHACDEVVVDASPADRKYIEYGATLLGFVHGDEIKAGDLPLLMAQDQPEAWARTKGGTREWHIGHFHVRRETRFTAGDTYNGVGVRVLPSLCSADAWHAMKGFVGEARALEAYLWNREQGYGGHFSSNVPVVRRGEVEPVATLTAA